MKATDEVAISPWEGLLLSVRIAAGRTAWVDQQLDDCVHRTDGEPDSPQIKHWLRESRNERRLLASAAKMAVDAGVAERLVRQVEFEGRVLADALERALDAIGANPDQRILAIEAAHRYLTVIDGEGNMLESGAA